MANYGSDEAIVISNFATTETGRILDRINKSLMTRSVWTNLLRAGVFPKGMGNELRTVVQLPSISNLNYATPALTPYKDLCGTIGHRTKHAKTEYLTSLGALRGQGPDICVSQGFPAFQGWLEAAMDSLVKDTRLIRDAIDRSQVYANSGTRYTAITTLGFNARIAGGTELSRGIAPVTADLANAPISFAGLRNLVAFVKEDLFAEPWVGKIENGGGYDTFALFVGSQEIIDSFRRETAVQTEINAMVTGGFKYGEKALSGLNFQTAGAWKGIAMTPDQFPLRYDDVGDGTGGTTLGIPIFIPPFIEVNPDGPGDTTTGYRAPNPAYRAAQFEVAFLLFDSAIKRLVADKYTGEGTAKFDPRLGNGEIQWHYVIDNSTNRHGDFGFHKYQFIQAYQPLRPHHIVTLHYKRCALVDLTAC